MRQPREFTIDVGDIDLAVHEWAGEGDPLLLLHATGFHARCWTEVVLRLPGRHVFAVDLRYHGSSGAAGDVDWGVMSGDIQRCIETLDLNRILGVGHSIGGYLLTRTAATNPERFKHLLLLDPVIMSPQRYRAMGELREGLSASDHPVSHRRNQWRDADEMFERFRKREPFDTWRTEVLRDYCEYALRPHSEQEWQQLACDPINEAAIYMHQRGNDVLYERLPDLQLPVTLLRAPPGEDGAGHNFAHSPTWPQLGSILPNCRETLLENHNHFIPMQDPDLVARQIEAIAEAGA